MNAVIVTPAYCRAELLALSLPHCRAVTRAGLRHVVLLNHWPVDDAANTRRCAEVALAHGCEVFDSGHDRGLQGSVNHWLASLPPRDQPDFLLGWDPDATVDRLSTGWDSAVLDVLCARPDFGFTGIWNIALEQKNERVPHSREMIAGTAVFIHPGLEMMNVGGWNMRFVRECGGFDEPNEFYGGIEIAMFHKVRGYKLAFLTEFHERCRYEAYAPFYAQFAAEQQAYADWKTAHIHGDARSFGAWMQAQTEL